MPHADRVPGRAGDPAAQGLGERGGGHGAQQGVGEVLEQEDADHLPRGEADRLQYGEIPQMAADTGADRPVHGEPGRDQRAQPEQAQHLTEEPVVALRLGAGLLPGGHLADRPGSQHGHGTLHGVGGVAGVRQAQPDHLAAGVRHGRRQRPHQARLLTGPVARLGAVGEPHDGQLAGGAGHGEGVAGLGQQGAGEAALQDHTVRRRGVEPVARDERRAADGGPFRSAAQLDRGAAAP